MNISVAAVCYLCNSAEPGDARHECACVGTRGCVHYLCLRNSAIEANAAWAEGDGVDSYLSPWQVCGVCHQNYGGRFAVTMAVHHVRYVREGFRAGHDNWKQIETKHQLMSALMGLQTRMTDNQMSEVMTTANMVMSLIEFETGGQDVSRRQTSMISNCIQARGVIMLISGGQVNVRAALNEFTMQCEITSTNDDQVGFMRALRLVNYVQGDFREGGIVADFFFETTLVD